MNSFERLYHLRQFGGVKRFHAERIIGENTTAYHSAQVALILIECVPDCSANLLKAAILHDLEEGVTGDIPAPVKWVTAGVGTAIALLERSIRSYFGIQEPNLTEEEKQLLSAADFLDAVLTVLDQRLLGNRFVDGIFLNYERFAPKVFPHTGTVDSSLDRMQQVWISTKCAYRQLRHGGPTPAIDQAEEFAFWNSK